MNFLNRVFKRRVKSPEELWPGLRAAIREGHEQKIRKIVAVHPTMLNWKDNRGKTALHWAAQYQSLSSVSCLLELGADPHLKDDFGSIPRMTANWYGEFHAGAYTDICLKIVERINEAEKAGPVPGEILKEA